MIHHLAAYGKAHREPTPDAIRKRLAADYALDLCERFGVKTTTARTGQVLPGGGRFCWRPERRSAVSLEEGN